MQVRDGAGHYEPNSLSGPADLRRVRVITFDLDNTLWEIQPVIERAERELHQFLTERYPAMTADMPLSVMTDLREQVARECPQKHHDFTFMRIEVLRQCAVRARYPEPQASAIAMEAFEVFYRCRNQVTLYNDVVPALDWLHRRYRLISISNGNADLRAIGIAHYFSSSVWAREVGVLKPGALMFLQAVIDSGSDPAALLHVGDDPLMDVAGARAVGYQTVWLDRFATQWPGEQVPANHSITSLSELIDLLQHKEIGQLHTLS
jgi:FMN hydrolase / 5-amino-6-(5-phospho-D-ribitylamino)uracil phosphatase